MVLVTGRWSNISGNSHCEPARICCPNSSRYSKHAQSLQKHGAMERRDNDAGEWQDSRVCAAWHGGLAVPFNKPLDPLCLD